jgi:plasmid maintenance system antidote protein VapI
MTQMWITQFLPRRTPVDLDILQESALAMAQSTIQEAMNKGGMKPTKLAETMGRHKSYVSRMLSGHHNLTIKTFALALAACGFEPEFGLVPIMWGWVEPTQAAPPTEYVPTGSGHLHVRGMRAYIGVLTPAV